MLDVFSFWHFMWIFAVPLFIFLVYLGFRNKSDKFKFYLLFSFTVFNYAVHFSRYWLEPDLQTYQLFFTDFCGFSTMMYPIFFMSKKQVLRDYMYYVGGVFAFLSLMYPNNIEGDPILKYNSIRFFITHEILVMVPILLIAWKMYTPSIKNIGWMYLFLPLGGIYNMALTSFFVYMGIYPRLIDFMGIWGFSDNFYNLFDTFAPFFMTEQVVNGVTTTVPIPLFYMLPGAFVIFIPSWILMSVPFMKFWRKKDPKLN